jgi:N-glycosidase YbiA
LVLPIENRFGVAAIAIDASESTGKRSLFFAAMTIYFYKADQPYGCFSNFSRHSIYLAETHWSTVEHYYQSRKFVDTEFAHLIPSIQSAVTPEAAAAIGRQSEHVPHPQWCEQKCGVMYIAVQQKFLAHHDLQLILLNTGAQEIVEDSPVDYFWGCGADRSGANHLGQILMEVRAELRQTPVKTANGTHHNVM